MLHALGDALDPAIFNYIGDAGRVPYGKPSPDIYADALRVIGVQAHQALAIEHTPDSAAAARIAGIDTWAYPSAAEGRAFEDVLGRGVPSPGLLGGLAQRPPVGRDQASP